jgi:hypothetical protein
MVLNISTEPVLKQYEQMTNQELIFAREMALKESAKYQNLQIAKKVQL